MVFTNMYDVAENGLAIHSVVELVNMDDLDLARWRVKSCVDGTAMAFSHHKLRKEAEKRVGKMHAAYLKVHGGKRKE